MSSSLTALSPLDGRYAAKVRPLQEHFKRIRVDPRAGRHRDRVAGRPRIGAVVHAARTVLREDGEGAARRGGRRFAPADAETREGDRGEDQPRREGRRVLAAGALRKQNREVGAGLGVSSTSPATSEDINNLAHLAQADGRARPRPAFPAIDRIVARLDALAKEHAKLAMLSRTHGQPATPHDASARRWAKRGAPLAPARAERSPRWRSWDKLNGATRQFSMRTWRPAPGVDWPSLAERFRGEPRGSCTTRSPPRSSRTTRWRKPSTHSRASTPSSWTSTATFGAYISLGYFRQKVKAGEVGLFHHAAQGEPHRLRELRRQPWPRERAPLPPPLGEAPRLALANRDPHRLDGASQRRRGAGATAFLGYESCLRGLAKLESNPRAHRRGFSRATGTCSPRRCRP